MGEHGRPNPTFGKLLFVDWILLICIYLRVLGRFAFCLKLNLISDTDKVTLCDFPIHLMTYSLLDQIENYRLLELVSFSYTSVG